MKIYTKTGDKGETSLIGGTRVPKYHLRIEAYGTVDELNSWIGLIRDQSIDEHQTKQLLHIQDRLFTIGSLLAADPEKSKMVLPTLSEEDCKTLESEMDAMDAQLEPLKSFILPGGHPLISQTHIARCVCRRTERLVVHLQNETNIDPIIAIYLNRLSDYLFLLARFFSKSLNAVESPWTPRI
ncbi:MAG: cob(I)yrinic acid a,c-diamide adenosyltransferase [Bacteroidota bacterium]